MNQVPVQKLYRLRKKSFTSTFTVLSGLLSVLLIYVIFHCYVDYKVGLQTSSDWAQDKTIEVGVDLNNKLESLHKALDFLLLDLEDLFSHTKPSEELVLNTLKQQVINNKGYHAFGMALEPGVMGDQSYLFAPFFRAGKPQYNRLDKYYNYSTFNSSKEKKNWYQQAKESKGAYWIGPFKDLAMDEFVLRAIRKIIVDDKFLGVVFLDINLDWLRHSIKQHDLGPNGYAVICTEYNQEIYHGLKGKNQIVNSIEEREHHLWSNESKQIDWFSLQNQKKITNELNDTRAWLNSVPVDDTGWRLFTVISHAIYDKSDHLDIENQEHHSMVLDDYLIISKKNWIIIITIVCFLILATYVRWVILTHNFGSNSLWVHSAFFSCILFISTVILCFCERKATSNLLDHNMVMSNKASVDQFKKDHSVDSLYADSSLPIFIPTGLFIQSIEFENATNVTLTGYIWQKIPYNIPSNIHPGVIFPEAISAEFEEDESSTYISASDGKKTLLKRWYFKSTLRENFDYSSFPFDRQSVWLRLWHKDFDKNVILVPDFESYNSLNPQALPGIERDFVLSGWGLKSSFFDIRMNQYNSNFGYQKYNTHDNMPELYFNIELHRSFLSPFIAHLFPLSVVLLMLYALVITTSKNQNTFDVFGFNVGAVIASLSALFFVVLVAHVQLRDFLSTNNIVYLEYFYLVTYIVILMIAVNAVAFSWNIPVKWIHFRDNLIPKLVYWPCLLFTLLICTTVLFWHT